MKRTLLVAVLIGFGVAALWNVSGAIEASTDGGDHAAAVVSAQDGEDAQDTDSAQNRESVDGQRVDIQVWTILAAAGAAGLGLLLLVLRMAMGWVKPPPPADEAHH
ncbi:MAG: hypothetical protein U1B78_04635 [Dehalococcoidia bacterium]|nr:hypothetical protein [Dehalococcoidia bacterium]